MQRGHTTITIPQHRDPIARLVLFILPAALLYLAFTTPRLGQARSDAPTNIRYAALVPQGVTQSDIQPLVAVLPTAQPTTAPTTAPEPTSAPAPTEQTFEALTFAQPTADPASFAPPPPQAPAWQPPAEPPPPPPPPEPTAAPTLVPAVIGKARDQAPVGAIAPNAGMPQPGDPDFAQSFEAPPAPNCHFVGGPTCRVPRTNTQGTADKIVDHVQDAINNAIDSVQP